MLISENNPKITIHKESKMEDILSYFMGTYSSEITGIGDSIFKKEAIRAVIAIREEVLKSSRFKLYVQTPEMESKLKEHGGQIYSLLLKYREGLITGTETITSKSVIEKCDTYLAEVTERYFSKHLGVAYLRYFLENNWDATFLGRRNVTGNVGSDWSRIHGMHVRNSQLGFDFYADLGGLNGTSSEFVSQTLTPRQSKNLTQIRNYLSNFKSLPIEKLDFGKMPWEQVENDINEGDIIDNLSLVSKSSFEKVEKAQTEIDDAEINVDVISFKDDFEEIASLFKTV